MNLSTDVHTAGDRVRNHTRASAIERIDAKTRANIEYFRRQPRDVVKRRMAELDREWDIERFLETNASSLALAGVALAATVNRKWLLLPGAVLGFLLMHAIQGWCPPLPVLRARGVRTRGEIDEEKFALKGHLEK